MVKAGEAPLAVVVELEASVVIALVSSKVVMSVVLSSILVITDNAVQREREDERAPEHFPNHTYLRMPVNFKEK